MNITSAQERCIEFHLWQRPDSIPESDWITNDQWLALKPNIDKMTASDVIGAFKQGNYSIGINQLRHLIK